MDTNAYLAKVYPSPPCWALISDVYATELADTVTDYKTINPSIRAIAAAFRLALHKAPNGFVQIIDPVDFCIVLMGKTVRTGLHHCGIYYQGKVLHGLDAGNQYQEMSVIADEYRIIEYWSKSA